MRRMTLIAAAALCAVACSAVATSGASAAETTGYTCLESKGGANEPKEFGNEHCSISYPGSGAGWQHVAIPAGETTQLTTKGTKTAVYTSSIGLATIEAESSEVECVGCHFTNSGSVGAMKASGEGGTMKVTGVIIKGHETKCEVHPVGNPTAVGVVETTPLKAETIGTQEARLEPVTPPILAEFEITAKTGQKCNIAGKFSVTGFTTGTASGSTGTFSVTLGSGALKLNGEPASLSGELTFSGGPTGAEHHPLALT